MKIKNILIGLCMAGFMVACQPASESEEIKAQIEELKKEIQEKSKKIHELEAELKKKDTAFADQMDKAVLVETETVNRNAFKHKIQVQGEVASRKNIDMSAETMGRVMQVNVSPGDIVKKGQMLIRLDASTLRNNIQEVKTSLELATTIFEKQKRLWEQEIGTEVQYLEAKNRKESLERQLATLQSQLDMATIEAPFNGRINDVDARVGEIVQPGIPILSLISLEEMYLKADVSEKYISDFQQGDSVEVYLPSIQRKVKTTISAISYRVNPANRTFQVEAKMNENLERLKPNQFLRMDMVDYSNSDALTVPSEIILEDNKGDFVFTVTTVNGKKVAEKVHIKRGMTYAGETEILEGLEAGTTVISVGYRDAVDGVAVKIAE